MDNEFNHHGIKGMRWGVRRYQNEDGSLTSAGKKRYKSGDHMNDKDPSDSATTRRVKKDYNSMTDLEFRSKYQTSKETYRKRVNRYGDPYMNSPLAKLGKSLAKSQTLSKIANSEGQRKRAEKLRDTLVKKADSELVKRGKSAFDVLVNGDKDWMGNSIHSDNVQTELRNRGKAAVERLLYSEDQIENKKFFGRYDL